MSDNTGQPPEAVPPRDHWVMRREPSIRRLDPGDPAFAALIRLSDEYMTRIYPAESNHLERIADLRAPGVAVYGAYAGEELVGCGAVKMRTDDGRYAEAKRVFVLERQRGRGFARALMLQLERHAAACGATVMRLETGVRQPEALGLYRRLGYAERPPFGSYRQDPLSVFLEKNLVPSAPDRRQGSP